MATYMSLLKFTLQAVQNIKKSPADLDESRKLFQSMGADLKQWYLAMGQYDAVAIFDAPDDETVAKLVFIIAAKGNITTQTFRIFSEEEHSAIVAALPDAAQTEGQIGNI
ncbi:MAG TPA: GYD domain-containing protein [Anaerolineales bacterium]|nr:GYD domain-containing protein [Anaerolineales bacterium]